MASPENSSHILVVDDSDDILELFGNLISKAGFTTQTAKSGQAALLAVSNAPPDLILLDIKMPAMDGYEVCRRLKSDPATAPIPVIFISAAGSESDKVKGFQLGAVDYIAKPFDNLEVMARIKTHLDLYRLKTQLEQTVTKRTRALDHERALLRCVIDAIPDLIVFKNKHGEFMGCNKAFENFTGLNEKELTRRVSSLFYAKEDEQQHYKKDLETLFRKKIDRTTEWVSCPDGRKALMEIVRNPFYDTDGELLGLVTSGRDITDQERARQEHQKLSSRLKQAQKLEAIGTLAGGIAHDFNNILSSVIGFTELAHEDAPSGSMLEDNLNEVLHAGMRAKELVSQILTFARQSDEKIKPVRVSLIAKETAKLLKATLPATIEIKNDIESESLVLCDPTQLHQVFMNICTNASHAMEDQGGYLTVALKDVQLDGTLTDKHGLVPGSYLKLEISDTGSGIPPEHLDKIFEPYFTTKPQGQGTGLGLAVVHGIVTGCNGAIEVNSNLGQGTTFTLYFPVANEDNPANIARPKQIAGGDEKILVVDDEAAIAKINSQVLQGHGYSVATCTNSLTALELFRSDPYHFDLLLTDMTMPGISGDELTRQIRAIQPDIPVIICTGYAKKLSAQKAKAIGINAFVMKPLSQSTLLYTVRKVLDLDQ